VNDLTQTYNELNVDEDLDDEAKEVAMVAYKKKYKGRCNKCGKWGHPSSKCSYKKMSSKDNDGDDDEDKPWHRNLVCNYCGKKGHIKRNCRKFKQEEEAKEEEEDSSIDEDDMAGIAYEVAL
jgi:hypothetical protein